MTGLDTAQLPPYQAARRASIIAAASELIEEQGFDRVQVRDVAIRAGVALGTLYRYFESKETLYAAVLRAWVPSTRLRRDVSTLPPVERFRVRIQHALQSLAEHPDFFRIVIMMKSTTDATAVAESADAGRVLDDTLMSELLPLPEEERRRITVMVWSLTTDLLSQHVQGRVSLADCTQVLDTFVDLVALRLRTAG